jgi:outer membrane receptor protein involved in Fe transport
MTLTSVTGYSKYDLDEICDCDFTGGNVFSAGITEEFDQFSQELRLTSDTDGRLSWITGVFYQEYDLAETDYIHVPVNSIVPGAVNALTQSTAGNALRDTANPRLFDQDSELWSVFAQLSFDFTEALRLTVGGRYSSEDKTGSRVTDLTAGLGGPSLPGPPSVADALYLQLFGIQRHSVAGERSEDEFSPLVNLQYRFGDNSMAYLSWANGTKSGGFDARSNRAPPNGTFEYEPEEANSYELGVKWGVSANAEVNAALFFTDYEDLQTSAFDGRLGFNVGNGNAEVMGLEVEGRWQATERLFFGGSVAYLDFEWQKYDGQCYYNPPPELLSTRVPGNCNYDGFTNQLAPEITAVLSGEYRQPIGGSLDFRAGLDVVYTDEYITSLTLDPNSKQDAYTKLNARISLGTQDGKWEGAIVARNLTDEKSISYSGDTPLAGSTFGARSYYGFMDPPRTVAFELLARF